MSSTREGRARGDLAPARATVHVALGSNLGDRERSLAAAVRRLELHPRVDVVAVSPWFENPAVGGPRGQPHYLNGVLEARTDLAPPALLGLLMEIERELGRERAPGVRDAPRTIDLDLLLYGRRVLRTEELVVPHPRMLERDFVLVPLAHVAPALILPQTGRTVLEERHRLALRAVSASWDAAGVRSAPEPVG